MSVERRAHPRAPGVLEGKWSSGLHPCRVSTLSIGGCFVECLTPPMVGLKVPVEMNLPDAGPPLRVVGTVVSTDPLGTGFSMQFVDLPEESLKRITESVEALFKKHAPDQG